MEQQGWKGKTTRREGKEDTREGTGKENRMTRGQSQGEKERRKTRGEQRIIKKGK